MNSRPCDGGHVMISAQSIYLQSNFEYSPGGKPKRATLRQTQVLVIPSNEEMNDFQVFDELIEAINSARRSARDYVTDHSLEKLDDRMYGEGDRDWV